MKTDYSPPGETFKTVAFLPRRGGQKPLHSSPGAGRIKSCIPPLEGGEENPHLPLGGERQKAVDRSLRSLALPRRGISFFLLLPARQANEVSDLQLFYTSLRGRDSEFFSLLPPGERNVDLQPSSWGGIVYLPTCSRGDECRSSTLLLGRDRTLFTSLPWGEKDSFNVSPRGQFKGFPSPPLGERQSFSILSQGRTEVYLPPSSQGDK